MTSPFPPTILPDITTPLVGAPNQPLPTGPAGDLGWLAALIGTWNSPTGAAATGYNVMSLPQIGAKDNNGNTVGYIVKNFPYYEEVSFEPIAGNAPNRTGDTTLNCNPVFYGQRVFIANDPDPAVPSAQNTLIHAESGAWLHFVVGPQLDGPYGPNDVPGGIVPVCPSQEYGLQISVPHGNSLLLVGRATTIKGTPLALANAPLGNIPGTDFPAADPTGLPFSGGDAPIMDPTITLVNQLNNLAQNGITVTSYIKLDLSTANAGGGLVEIPFGNSSNATVTSMRRMLFIETLSNGAVQLQYTQLIMMNLLINGATQAFQHIDANTLLKVRRH